jgi:sulfatase modifying factor 1
VIFGYTQQSLSSVQPGFVLVEAGSFSMGSNDGDDDEKPMHTVTISRSFYMSRYEVIQKQWREVMGTNPSNFKGDDLPVETVSWYDVVEYCNRLSTREGLTPCYIQEGSSAAHSNRNSVLFILTGGQRQSEDLKVERVIRCDFSATGYRLPTEAEWEYAARGGTESRGYLYSGSNWPGDVSWYDENTEGKTQPVGQKKQNELGLYDMSGNVWEMCWDWYNGYRSTLKTDPIGPSSGSDRVARGGSWVSFAELLRVANRGRNAPSERNYALGFRPVRTAE